MYDFIGKILYGIGFKELAVKVSALGQTDADRREESEVELSLYQAANNEQLPEYNSDCLLPEPYQSFGDFDASASTEVA